MTKIEKSKNRLN